MASDHLPCSYFLQFKNRSFFLGNCFLRSGLDADDRFPLLFNEKAFGGVLSSVHLFVASIFPELEMIDSTGHVDLNLNYTDDDRFENYRGQYFLNLADLGFQLVAKESSGRISILLSKTEDPGTYYGREMTLKMCALNFIPAA
jgi:hypothetical protein